MPPTGPKPDDRRATTGTFPIAEARCWNHMTPPQQRSLRETGLFSGYGGGPCDRAAEVRVWIGSGPGPRFYCRACGVAALTDAAAELAGGADEVGRQTGATQ